MEENDITYKIRGCIFNVYNNVGPGLFESVYEAALLYELNKAGLKAKNQVELAVHYDDILLDVAFRIDILVEDEVVIEIKSCETMLPVFEAQIISYLKLSNKRVGILVNFNVSLLKNGYKRIVNNL